MSYAASDKGAQERSASAPSNSNRRMQIISILIVAAVALPLILFPEQGKQSMDMIFGWMTRNFDVVFLGMPLACMLFLVYLAISRFGDIRLSARQTDKPEFSKSSWIMMVFLVIFLPGLDIMRSQGRYWRNRVSTQPGMVCVSLCRWW